MPPSAMFYNDSLIPSAANGRISWSGMLNPDMPLVFIGCSAPENCIDEVILKSRTSTPSFLLLTLHSVPLGSTEAK